MSRCSKLAASAAAALGLLLALASPAGAAVPVTLHVPVELRSNGAVLNWTEAPISGFVSYEIHRGSGPGFTPSPETRLATLTDRTTTSFIDETAQPATQVTYKVVTADGPSNEQTFTLPSEGQVERIITLNPQSSSTFIWSGPLSGRCANTGADPELRVGEEYVVGPPPWYLLQNVAYRSILKFDLSAVPSGATFVDATVSLWRDHARDSVILSAHRLTRDWAEGVDRFVSTSCSSDSTAATWTRASSTETWTTAGGDFPPAEAEDETSLAASASAGWDEVDVTDAAASWMEGVPNYGLLIKLPAWSNQLLRYSSDDVADAMRLPRLHVTFFPADAVLQAVPIGLDGSDRATQKSNFGGKRQWVAYRQPVFGTRAAIRTPESDFQLPGGTLAVFRVAAQDFPSRDSGQLQAGFGMTNNASMNCGGRSSLTYFYEFIAGPSSPFVCRWLDISGVDPPFQYGHSRVFTVARDSSECGSGESTKTWRVWVDDLALFCATWVNRLKVGPIQAGGEIAHRTEILRAQMSACYGCSGARVWQKAYNVSVGGPSWKTIRSAQNEPESQSRGWTIAPLPGAWSISNSG